ncbi:MAG: L-seryl-tRNA(Sec) selenium transferase [Euzebya sp.]
MPDNPLEALPRIDRLLEQASDLRARYGREDVKAALNRALDQVREGLTGSAAAPDVQALAQQLLASAAADLATTRTVGPRRIINAAGVVVHTNLGRAPLSAEAVQAMVDAAGYCDLEFRLADGRRGSRGAHVDGLLATLTGAEDAMVVNNCAAALVLALSVLAAGREVPVSRGHLVEIGGSFRLPEIMAASGASLLEVGTTNRTRANDYQAGTNVGALLTVHPSNFSQVGFVTQPRTDEVAVVARSRGVPLIHDAGSGLPVPVDGVLSGEMSMAQALQAGADLVLASGDKLLGGPQAGLIVGRASLISRLRRAPLARALRVDKLRLAALNATLLAHLRGQPSTVAALLAPDPGLVNRVNSLASIVGGTVITATTMIGGGSAPGVGVESPVIAVVDHNQLQQGLRRHDPPIICRVHDGYVLLDLRTVDPADDAVISAALQQYRQQNQQ